MYELTTELGTRKVPFLVPAKPKPPRIGSLEWIEARGGNATAVFNGGYDVDGTRLDIGNAEPWTAVTPDGEWHHFWTQPEALQWVLQEARK